MSNDTEGLFHISENGPRPCHARDKSCPKLKGFPDAPHFSDYNEAKSVWTQGLIDENGMYKSHSKRPNNSNRGNRGNKGGNGSGRPNRSPKRRKQELVRGEEVFKFHKDLGFPPGLIERYQNIKVALQWSPHAMQAAQNEEYGSISQLRNMDTSEWELVEVKARKRDMKVMRLLYRSQPDQHGVSNCFVLEVEPTNNRPWKVITAWKNEAWDKHATLNTDNYYTVDEAKVESQKTRQTSPQATTPQQASPPRPPTTLKPGEIPKPGPPRPPGALPKPAPPRRDAGRAKTPPSPALLAALANKDK